MMSSAFLLARSLKTRLPFPKALSFSPLRSYSSQVPDYLSKIPETHITTLPNGLRVASENTFAPIASVGLYINAGSSFETPANNGTAHFLEHLAFKGTKRRARTALELEVENMGGSLNAYTSREQTAYYARVFKEDVGKAVDIISDIIQNSVLSEESIEAERSVILREHYEVSKESEEVIFDHLHSATFCDSGLGHTILGPVENIKKISRNDVLNYISTYYTADRMVLVGSGGVDHSELVKIAEQAFSSLPKTSPNVPPVNKNPSFNGTEVLVKEQRQESKTHLALAWEGVSWSSEDYFTSMLIQTLVGNYDRFSGGGRYLTSRLAEQLDKEPLINKFSSFTTCYHHTGVFGLYLVTENGNEDIEFALSEVFREYSRLAQDPTASEIARAKNKLKASFLLSLNGTQASMEDIGRQVLTLGRRIKPAELFARIDAINEAQIKKFLQERFVDSDFSIVTIGDTHHNPDYVTLRSFSNKIYK